MDEGSGMGALDATANTHFATLINMTDANWRTDVACASNLAVKDVESVKDNSAVYPNPVKRGNDLQFAISDNSASEVALYDASGKLIKNRILIKIIMQSIRRI